MLAKRSAIVSRLVVAGLAGAGLLALACDREMIVGGDAPDASCQVSAGADAGLPTIPVGWQTGFENGLGDWDLCYVLGGGTYPAIVSSPVHTGQFAGMFTLNTDAGSPAASRCKKVGVLPQAAYYSAWYYVPASARAVDHWNLLHFEGNNSPKPSCLQELWDVSLDNDADGGLVTSTYDFIHSRGVSTGPSIPIGQWFQLEVFLKRASDGTGEFDLYLNGSLLQSHTNLVTDPTIWGEWHVGNLAEFLAPSVSTVYVDDVKILNTGP